VKLNEGSVFIWNYTIDFMFVAKRSLAVKTNEFIGGGLVDV
jgi:hypothetical protein